MADENIKRLTAQEQQEQLERDRKKVIQSQHDRAENMTERERKEYERAQAIMSA